MHLKDMPHKKYTHTHLDMHIHIYRIYMEDALTSKTPHTILETDTPTSKTHSITTNKKNLIL